MYLPVWLHTVLLICAIVALNHFRSYRWTDLNWRGRAAMLLSFAAALLLTFGPFHSGVPAAPGADCGPKAVAR